MWLVHEVDWQLWIKLNYLQMVVCLHVALQHTGILPGTSLHLHCDAAGIGNNDPMWPMGAEENMVENGWIEDV